MSQPVQDNPAEVASKAALAAIELAINDRRSFLLEAGAGAGKTYSLIESLKYIIRTKAGELKSNHQKVACITYTNAAADEINSRLDGSEDAFALTIHSFCWSLLADFQTKLRELIIVSDVESWQTKIAESGGINDQKIIYDLGYRSIKEDRIYINHDDVLTFTIALLGYPKFRNILAKRYPIIFIDEYQDTNDLFANSLAKHFLDEDNGLLIGFFGDHWQKIYNHVIGKIEHENLTIIGKKANFRSVRPIVDVLNLMRPDLPQNYKDSTSTGNIRVYHSNEWIGVRRAGAGGHWTGDLPEADAHNYFVRTKNILAAEGWDFNGDKTKVLMLTHNVLATEQGYKNLARVFPFNEAFIKKEDPYIAFFVDILEPALNAYREKKYGQMFLALNDRVTINSLLDKKHWTDCLDSLVELTDTGSIGDVIDYISVHEMPRLPDRVRDKEAKLAECATQAADDNVEQELIKRLRAVKYSEVTALTKFLGGHTPFNTKHGVKGAEFENVLVVLGRGWNSYNFGEFLELSQTLPHIPAAKTSAYERNRNLFYVACSRPRTNLCLLFTQLLSDPALQTLDQWFGGENILALPMS